MGFRVMFRVEGFSVQDVGFTGRLGVGRDDPGT